MKVFVTGATGVLGRRVVTRLVAAGHEVTGVARDDAKAAALAEAGARPARVGMFDRPALTAAAAGHDAVCNLATSIPPTTRMAWPGAWAANDRIRSEGSRLVAGAASAAGCAVLVQESITFTYADGGDRWLDEDAALDVPPFTRSALDAEASAARFTDGGGRGVVLRFALFYGPDSTHTVDQAHLARRGVAPVLGRAGAYHSSVTTDDAAAAVVVALAAPAGTWNVADDEPLTGVELAEVMGAAVGGRARRPPAVVAKLGSKAAVQGRSQRVANARFRGATGWAPATPSARVGWPATVEAMTGA